MSSFTVEDFNKFLKSFKKVSYEDENHKLHNCYDSLSELSKSNSEPYNSLISHPFKMYGLDWMVNNLNCQSGCKLTSGSSIIKKLSFFSLRFDNNN